MSHTALEDHLLRTGWRQLGDLRRSGLLRARQYEHSGGTVALVPAMADAPDYTWLMADAITAAARAEGRSVRQLLMDLHGGH